MECLLHILSLVGIHPAGGGRFAPERVAGLKRNAWQESSVKCTMIKLKDQAMKAAFRFVSFWACQLVSLVAC